MEKQIPFLNMYIDNQSGVCIENWNDTWSVDMHKHRYTEMLLIDKGSCNHIYKEVSTLLVPGDVVIIEPGQAHGYGVLGNLSIYNCQFIVSKMDEQVMSKVWKSGLMRAETEVDALDFTQQMIVLREDMHAEDLPSVSINNSKQGVVHLDPAEFAFFVSLLQRAKEEENELLKQKYVEVLLLTLAEKIQKQIHVVKSYSKENQRVIAEVLAQVEADLTVPFDINEVAAFYSFSPNYFRKIFKDFTGLSPIQYINKLRVMRASEYISQGGMSIKEAAEKVGMVAAMVAVAVNLVLDYVLIFGVFGFPKMGVEGAALATVIAKGLEMLMVMVWAHANPARNPYIPGLYRGFRIPAALLKDMFVRSLPLLFNEFFWSLGMSAVAQCYSVRGLDVVAARNIASTINNLCNVIYVQMGVGVGILIGQMLGAGEFELARQRKNHLSTFCLTGATIVALIMVPIAIFFPSIYNTEAEIKALATIFILIQAGATPLWSYTNFCYFILRSGGKTGITFFFDFFYTWVIMIPAAFLLCYFTKMDIRYVFAIVTFGEVIKVVIGYFLIRSDKWINRIVE